MKRPAATRAPGRPRSEATRGAILNSAIELLESENYAQISIERIAARAKVGKQSIYRWWTSKADVILEAYSERALRRLPRVDGSGDAFSDLEHLLKRFFEVTRLPPVRRTIRGLVAEAQLDGEFRAKFYSVFVTLRRGLIRQVLQHGIALGQIRADLDVELMIDLLYGAYWYRLLSGTAEELDDAMAKNLVATLRPTLEAGPLAIVRKAS